MPEPATGHDIFISYASEDRDTAQQLAAALEAQGWTVWWDRELIVGSAFDEVIERELESAGCVIVGWSQAAAKSDWVRDEAEEARSRGVIVPVLFEPVKVPLRFRRIHSVDLSSWGGSLTTPGFQQLVDGITQVLGPSPAERQRNAAAEQARQQAEEEERKAAEEVEDKHKAEQEQRRTKAEEEARQRALEAAKRRTEEDGQQAGRDRKKSDAAPQPLPRREERTGETAPSETIAKRPPKNFKWKWPLASVLAIVALVGIVSLSVKEKKTAVDDSTRLVEHERIAAAEVARLTNETRAALEVEDYATALERAEAALEKQPENAELLTLREEIEAARMAAAEKAKRAEEVERLRALARTQSESGDNEGALESIEAALKLAPEDDELEALRKEVAERQRALLEQQISEDVSRLVGEARASQAAGNPQAGVEKIEQALALTPGDQELLRLRNELQTQHTAALIERRLKLGRQDKQAMQRVLTALGFDTRGIDGIFGPSTRGAISDWQRSRDDEVTGYLSAPQYDALRSEAYRPEMVAIPAGSFRRGDSVVVVAGFAMGRYEVTFDQYDAFARATGRRLPDDEGWGRGDRPVIDVSWEDATAYTEWLSKQTGKRYRLPTEAEWDYAARAGTNAAYWWGDDINEGGKVWANCDGCGSQWDGEQTAPVGSFPANGFGLHDTAGNVWEWVQDCAKNDCDRRVFRGGSWFTKPPHVRSANRYWNNTDFRHNNRGFRLAQDIE